MPSAITIWSSKYKFNALALFLVIVLAGGVVWFRNNSPYQPAPISSQASEERAHWSYSQMPVTVNLQNHASAGWQRYLKSNGELWGAAKTVNFDITESSPSEDCEILPGKMSFCSWNEADGWLSQMTYIQGPNNPHLVATAVAVNDAYLVNRNSPYASDAWRNYVLCQSIGWTMGMQFSFEPLDGPRSVESCMNAYATPKAVEKMQKPDAGDISDLIKLYGHEHEAANAPTTGKIYEANIYWQERTFGQVVESTSQGFTSYELDLGDGYKMYTVVQQAKLK
jgi:hypothetical protein